MKYFVYVKGQSLEKEISFLRLPIHVLISNNSVKNYLVSINQSALTNIPYLIVDADYDDDIEARIREQFTSISGFLGAFGEAV